MISPELIHNALFTWTSSPSMTQETATRLITSAYFRLGEHLPVSIHQIEYEDGTVDYSAWRRNRINMFTRWFTRQTDEHRKKFEMLIPSIIEAIRLDNNELYHCITAGNSISYRATQALKESVDAVNASVLGAPLSDFEREYAEAEAALINLRVAYQQRHDQ